MKIGKKQRLAILDRAYDKAAKVLPGGTVVLADLERSVLAACLEWSRLLAYERRQDYRRSVWRHFGWDTPKGQAKYNATIKEIVYDKNRSTIS